MGDGRILYPGSPALYRIDLAENKIDYFCLEMPEHSIALDDISSDGRMALFSARGLSFGGRSGMPSVMVVKYLDDMYSVWDKKEFVVPANYQQPGSGKFSPDSKKFAYAAGDIGSVNLKKWPSGIPEGKFSDKFAVFEVDIETKQQTELTSREEYQNIDNMGKFIVESWTGNIPNYSYKISP